MRLGSLGLTIELWNPGAIVPGVVGGLCLLLAFFAFQILPINYVGLLLIVFGLLLLILEMFTPTFGLLATGGIVSMVMGAVMLVDSSAPELQLGWPFILSSMLMLGLVVAGLARLGIRAQRTTPVTGIAGMIDQVGQVRTAIQSDKTGSVLTRGEIWVAKSDGDYISEGVRVRVVDVKGMTLTDVTEARLLIEATIVGYATVKATEDDFSRLEDNINAVEALTRDGQLDSKAELNIQFHITLAECTKNPVLILIMRLLMDTLIAVHRPVTVEDTEDIIQSRRRFLSHLRQRDKKGATREMNNHLSHLHELFSA